MTLPTVNGYVKSADGGLLVRFLKFGEVYTAATDDKKRQTELRKAWNKSENYPAQAGQAFRYIRDVHRGVLPADIRSIKKLIQAYTDYNNRQAQEEKAKLEILTTEAKEIRKEIKRKADAELAELAKESDPPTENNNIEPAEHPVTEAFARLNTWATENPDKPIDERIRAELHRLLAELDRRAERLAATAAA